MALLGVFINSGVACLSSGLTCFAHGLTNAFSANPFPDWAGYQMMSGGATSVVSIPVTLESLGTTAVIWRNANGAGINGNMLVATWHGIIR